jgi:pilus assembly protein CpaF
VQAPECADPAAVRDEVIERLQKKADLNSSHTRDEVKGIVAGIMGEMSASIKGLDKEALLKDVLNEALGLGPIEELICRDDITEVMINSTKDVFIERAGRVERARVSFTGEKQLKRIIDRMVAFSGRRVDESSPMVDARLRNGFRLNVVLPPVSVAGPVVTIRKFRSAPMTMEDLLKNGSVSNEQAAMLKEAVLKRQNICVSGGTGSGKTTLLNVLSSFIPEGERIITIEDSAELKLLQGHVISLESRPANIEGKGMVTIRDLVRNALRMRPDRIIVGECRGGEALDMLQAMNTGHDGSLTTIHANSPRDMILRLETLVMFSGFDLPSRAIREQIASAINLLVHVEREEGGSRRVASICRVRGLEDGQIVVEEDTVV